MKKIIFLLIITNYLFATVHKDSWTINLFTTNSMGQANHYIEQNLKFPKAKVFIFKVKNKYTTKYTVTYGLFKNYIETNKFLDKERKNLKFKNPYIKKHKYNLSIPNKVPTLIKVINYRNGLVVVDEVINKPIVKSESKQIKQNKKLEKRDIDKNRYIFGISLKYSSTILSGDIKVLSSDSTVDFESDLGLIESESILIPQISVQKNGHKLFFTYYSNSYTVTNTLSKDLIIKNFTWSQGSSINSTIDISFLTMGYKLDINSYDIGVSYHSIEKNIDITEKPTTVNSNSIKINGSYSTISLTLDKKYKFDDSALFYGLDIGQGSTMKYLEYKIGLEYYINNDIDISASYKVKDIEIQSNNYNSNLNLNSMYLKVLKRF